MKKRSWLTQRDSVSTGLVEKSSREWTIIKERANVILENGTLDIPEVVEKHFGILIGLAASKNGNLKDVVVPSIEAHF